jgi:anaphase-promoting complex subunit 2
MLEYRQREWQRKQNSITDDDDDNNDEPTEVELYPQNELYEALSTLEWVTYPLRMEFVSSIQHVTERVIRQIIEGEFESEGLLSSCLVWKEEVLLPFVSNILSSESFTTDRWNDRLQYAIYESFIHVRSSELFELTTEYPESLPAVRELSLALDGTGRVLYSTLANEWRCALEKRLIHPGAQTSQIIDVYISTIKVLREMDSSGELLDVVTRPVREYLRGREDTIRCIVTSLTEEEGGGELYAELRRMDAKPLEEAELD